MFTKLLTAERGWKNSWCPRCSDYTHQTKQADGKYKCGNCGWQGY